MISKTFDTFEENTESILSSIKSVLLEKNKRYGNAALDPLQIFSKHEETGIGQRLDDKLARIKNSDVLRKNDVFDLLGYIILLCIKKTWTNFNELID